MLVKDVMRHPVLTVDERATLRSAYQVMQDHQIRHLPVTRSGRLGGMVTDRDIRLAVSPLAEGGPRHLEATVGSIMSQPVLCADPLDPVEEAARLMRRRKIGALPVLEGEELVGIVTGIDLLDALVTLTGVEKPSGRLEVRLPDRPGELGRLTQFLGREGINIHSLLTYPDDPKTVRAVLRVGTTLTHRIADMLRVEGFNVVWPPHKPGPK